MTGLPDADPNLEASSERRCDSIPDAAPLDDSAEAEEDGFNFWRDVIGDDIVCSGVVYSSDEWTHDGEGDVRRLTVAEKSVRNADRLHPDDPDHPLVTAAYTALAAEHDDAMRREELMAAAVEKWNRELSAELDAERDGEDSTDQSEADLVSQPASPKPSRPARRRFPRPRPTRRR